VLFARFPLGTDIRPIDKRFTSQIEGIDNDNRNDHQLSRDGRTRIKVGAPSARCRLAP